VILLSSARKFTSCYRVTTFARTWWHNRT